MNSLIKKQNYYLNYKNKKYEQLKKRVFRSSFFIYRLMRLKKYIEFIKESLKEDIIDEKLWILDPDDILEYFIDFEDEGYDITIELGFQEEYEDFRNGTKEKFTTKVLPGNINPSYWIEISTEKVTSNEDLTDSLKFAIDIMSDKLNISDQLTLFPSSHENYPGKITICDGVDGDEYGIDLLYDNKIIIKGTDTYIKDGDSVEHIHLCIFIRQKDSIDITPKMMADYYEWKYDHSSDRGNIYTDIELEDMADTLLERKALYKEALVGGTEHMWDYYDSHNYIPDTNSFFQYSLNKENEILMVKAMIKEIGGWDIVKDENIVTDKDVEFKTEEEFIKYVLEERFYGTLNDMCRDSDICQEIKQVVADWEMGAHVDDNYDAIVSEFDDIVGKEFEFEKIKKEVEKSYTSTDSDGNKKVNKYKTEVTYYRIPFDEKWLDVTSDWDYDDMKRHITDLSDLFNEYCGQEYFSYSLNPRINDWGSVDSKALNEDIKSYLTRFISN